MFWPWQNDSTWLGLDIRRSGLVVRWERFGILNKERPSKLDLLRESKRFFPTKTFQSFKSNRVRPDQRDHVLPDYYSRPSTMTSPSSLTGFMSDTFSSSFLLWTSQSTTPFQPIWSLYSHFSLTWELQSPGGSDCVLTGEVHRRRGHPQVLWQVHIWQHSRVLLWQVNTLQTYFSFFFKLSLPWYLI